MSIRVSNSTRVDLEGTSISVGDLLSVITDLKRKYAPTEETP